MYVIEHNLGICCQNWHFLDITLACSNCHSSATEHDMNTILALADILDVV